jgi:hypothetical protein
MCVLEAVGVYIESVDLIEEESLILSSESIGRNDGSENWYEEEGYEHHYGWIRDRI